WKSIKKIGSEVMIIDLNSKLDKNI
ncbi:MAG TPA: YlmC/YmxH family sporulation protein, partial [Desulfosporosinus sp.]|nr:YlmC/YmxH family sporulation protein [Desulfosporosinus sp.]